jgi:hypothetical protein
MKKATASTSLAIGALLIAAAGSLSAASCGDDYCIDRYTIGSGGELHSESASKQWILSGTIGQWEATHAWASAGGGWQLTGGFWSLSLEALADFLFRDSFEEEGG